VTSAKFKSANCIIVQAAEKRQGDFAPVMLLSRRVQHILNKYSVSPGWVVDKNVSNRADKFAVLNNGAAAHE